MTDYREGLARITNGDGVVVAWYRYGNSSAEVALVAGEEFADLVDLLDAVDRTGSEITRGRNLPVDPEADLRTPVAQPRKIMCIGQNYVDHVHESGREKGPEHPDVFAKWVTALNDPEGTIPLPPESDLVDFESELVIVVGHRARRVPEDRVTEVVFGYTAGNDGSVRDFQFHTAQRTSGKAWDAMTPLGPVVVPAEKVGGVFPDLRISGRLNGEIMQYSCTDHLMFGVSRLVSYISTWVTLEPGDVIFTGTPSGVGFVREPRLMLCDGDEFEVDIEGIGVLRSHYATEEGSVTHECARED